MTRPKVFVTQESFARGDEGEFRAKYDLSNAAERGQLVFLFGHGPVALMQDATMRAIHQRLLEEKFDPAVDWVLCVGDNTLAFDLGLFLGAAFGRARVLRWDRRRQEYDVLEAEVPVHLAERLREAYNRGYPPSHEESGLEQD